MYYVVTAMCTKRRKDSPKSLTEKGTLGRYCTVYCHRHLLTCNNSIMSMDISRSFSIASVCQKRVIVNSFHKKGKTINYAPAPLFVLQNVCILRSHDATHHCYLRCWQYELSKSEDAMQSEPVNVKRSFECKLSIWTITGHLIWNQSANRHMFPTTPK